MPANGMSLAPGLISAETDNNASVVSSAVGSWGITTDDVRCGDGSIACLGASAGSAWVEGAN